ncbi:ATP-binding cassette subfamily B protein [Acidovorax soli]|uniref:ATP-binding cassette subfamily B protein n=1 Tax=Acidovorax soli TaxID=592050 RepID=A0A7X0PAL9_9BURK|nr:ABC transporter ATP-binding protein [Acidovorax soli]MBB6558368.1 ATP-binding cassette subfamily B protein [Acidovorax soli]
MIRTLVLAGHELAGYTDKRLRRGLRWSVAESLFAAVPFGIVAWLLLDVLRGTGSVQRAGGAALVLLACLVVRIACARRAMPTIFSGAYAMMGQARLRVADHLRRLPLGWLAGRRSGSLAATLAADMQLVEDIWAHFLGVFFGGLLVPAFLSVLLLWLDWRLGLAVLATLPLAFGLLVVGQRVLIAQAGKLQAANAHGQAEVLDYVQGIAVVRAFEPAGEGGATFQRLATALAAMRRQALAIELWPTPLVALFGCAVESGFALAVWLGAQRLGSTLSGEMLLVFAVLSLPVYRQLFEVGLSFLLLRYAQEAMQRIRDLLAEPALPEPAEPQAPQGHAIELADVRFGYGGGEGEPVLHGISAHIPERSLTAVVGRSGSGKTTLLHLVARLWDVDAGAVRIGGVDVRAMGSELLHRQVAMAFQDVVLFSGTVRENLAIGRPGATHEEIVAAARLAEAHGFIERLPEGYDTPLGEGGARLSGGERQRISIARALLKDAPIVLLDEATASVDPSNAAQIQRALSTLVRDRTVVVIAHRLRSVVHADQILVLDGGRLVEQGRHAELLARGGVYATLWQCQQQTRQWQIGAAAP